MRDIGQVLRASASTLPTPPTSGAERLAERAEREGLIDVAFTTIDSPLGQLIAAATPAGLVRLCYRELAPHADRLDSVLDDLARRISPRILEAPRRMERVRRELEEYFDGRRRRFDVPLDLRTTGGFTKRVLRATSRIPYGRVHTYAEMAARAGNARATRAAGNALGSNPIVIVIPCHRVISSRGSIGGYSGGPGRKEFLLGLEGWRGRGGAIVTVSPLGGVALASVPSGEA